MEQNTELPADGCTTSLSITLKIDPILGEGNARGGGGWVLAPPTTETEPHDLRARVSWSQGPEGAHKGCLALALGSLHSNDDSPVKFNEAARGSPHTVTSQSKIAAPPSGDAESSHTPALELSGSSVKCIRASSGLLTLSRRPPAAPVTAPVTAFLIQDPHQPGAGASAKSSKTDSPLAPSPLARTIRLLTS